MIDEIKYLTELNKCLEDYATHIKLLDENNSQSVKKVHEILLDTVTKEAELRKSCEIGLRFNIIRTQLQDLLSQFEDEIKKDPTQSIETDTAKEKLGDDETIAYVYLFNSQGVNIKTWQKLLLPQSMIEHSINRPIYIDRGQIETMLRSKPNKLQHAYIEVSIKKNDIIQPTHCDSLKDQYGYTLLRVRQGALKTENIRLFLHNGISYRVLNDGTVLPI